MPVPNRLTRTLQETLGHEAGDAMVDWLNQSEKQHEELSHQLAEFRQETRADFAEVRQEMRAQTADLRKEMAGVREEMRAQTDDLRKEIGGVREEMRKKTDDLGKEIVGVREEMRTGFANIDSKFAAVDVKFAQSEAAAAKRHEDFMRWTLGFWVLSLATVVGALIGFARVT